MENLTTTNQSNQTIVAFKIGRGGKYYNPNHLSYLGEKKISEFTSDLFLHYENESEILSKINGKPNLEELFDKATSDDPDAIAFFEHKLKMPLGEQIYLDCNGNPVGLSKSEADSGIGRIDLDGIYDTVYTCYLSDCSEKELQAIWEARVGEDFLTDVELFAKVALKIEEGAV